MERVEVHHQEQLSIPASCVGSVWSSVGNLFYQPSQGWTEMLLSSYRCEKSCAQSSPVFSKVPGSVFSSMNCGGSCSLPYIHWTFFGSMGRVQANFPWMKKAEVELCELTSLSLEVPVHSVFCLISHLASTF